MSKLAALFTPERLAILDTLSRHGIPWLVIFDTKTETYSIRLEGFYKSGSVDLRPADSPEDVVFTAHARYGEVENIRFVDDLAALNYRWWRRSEDRADAWKQPDPSWVPLLLANSYLKVREIPATTVYDPA